MSVAHSKMVANLCKSGRDIMEAMTPLKAHLDHMAIGVCGEAGELADAIKKHTVYGKPLDILNVKEELGDLEFYMEGVRSALCLTREECLHANIDKLSIRYGKQYSDKAAADRADKVL